MVQCLHLEPSMTHHRSSLLLVLTLLMLAAPACDSDPQPPPRPVAALSDGEAQTLCQEFFTAACASLLSGDPACSSCQPCTQAASLTTIRAECGSGITDAAVRHCISSQFDMPTCTGPERGGCMFDVADELCPLPSGP
jgi:hypothetical protein